MAFPWSCTMSTWKAPPMWPTISPAGPARWSLLRHGFSLEELRQLQVHERSGPGEDGVEVACTRTGSPGAGPVWHPNPGGGDRPDRRPRSKPGSPYRAVCGVEGTRAAPPGGLDIAASVLESACPKLRQPTGPGVPAMFRWRGAAATAARDENTAAPDTADRGQQLGEDTDSDYDYLLSPTGLAESPAMPAA